MESFEKMRGGNSWRPAAGIVRRKEGARSLAVKLDNNIWICLITTAFKLTKQYVKEVKLLFFPSFFYFILYLTEKSTFFWNV